MGGSCQGSGVDYARWVLSAYITHLVHTCAFGCTAGSTGAKVCVFNTWVLHVCVCVCVSRWQGEASCGHVSLGGQ